jgi:hypothetical protein
MIELKPGRKLYDLSGYLDIVTPASVSMAWYAGAYLAYDAINAASYAASKTDLTGNGRTGVDINGGLVWTGGLGWTGVANAALSAPALPDSTWSAMIKFNGATAGTFAVFGTRNVAATSYWLAYPRLATKVSTYWGTSTPTEVAEITSGTIGIAGSKLFVNGSHVATFGAQAGTAAYNMYIAALNNGGPAIQEFRGRITSFIMFNSTISDGAMASLNLSMP